ncbi:methyltransferase domain-containing protein [Acerihabitans arboris]|uniref:Helix-turn-helix domain-containing protein n=1 Tax=Acerihabitans arboris TaxID=2691583 RepID=A0A845SPL8_9GAMM|nr:methyltransferase domain-containing protein [Acerihabitans arboris]NDL66039.1 helix-turn-helix domain-containing protein [Acerihabitans arboris]
MPYPALALAANLSKARKLKGLTLNGLSELSGVAKATLSGLEKGEGNPTIETIWRLACTLRVPFGQLVADDGLDEIGGTDGISVKLVERQNGPQIIESYMMTIPAGQSRKASPHMLGLKETVTVLMGTVLTGQLSSLSLVHAGDSIQFNGDAPHLYEATAASDVKLLVTLVYPDPEAVRAISMEYRIAWPQHQNEWEENIRSVFSRLCIEVQNGLCCYRILFEDCPLNRVDAQVTIAEFIDKHRKSWQQVQLFSVCTPIIGIIIFPHLHPFRDLPNSRTDCQDDLFAQARQIAAMVSIPVQDSLLSVPELKTLTRSSSMIVSVLATEALLRMNNISVPGIFQVRTEMELTKHPSIEDRVLFEDRINVDSYDAYEIVHPAYGRQVLAIAPFLRDFSSSPSVLDIGTGPGLPLYMLLELCPDMAVTAIDPSKKAFNHLSRRFETDRRVKLINSGIDDFDAGDQTFNVVISIGASHHLDTTLLFHRVRSLLPNGGRFIISDEMLSPFTSRVEREKNLLVHHLKYIANTLASVPLSALDPSEQELVTRMNNEVPYCLFLALSGEVPVSAARIRTLLSDMQQKTFPEPVSHPGITYYRFHILELEALVAGMDYEVEQKTYPQRLVHMAASAGFDLAHHQRLYRTDGDSDWDAGTHLFVFEKN